MITLNTFFDFKANLNLDSRYFGILNHEQWFSMEKSRHGYGGDMETLGMYNTIEEMEEEKYDYLLSIEVIKKW